MLTSVDILSNLSVRTPLYYGQFPMSRQNSHIFYIKKKTSIIRTLSNTNNGHLILRTLLLTDTAEIRRMPNPDQVNLHRVNLV